MMTRDELKLAVIDAVLGVVDGLIVALPVLVFCLILGAAIWIKGNV
jgi:hypothetical protein